MNSQDALTMATHPAGSTTTNNINISEPLHRNAESHMDKRFREFEDELQKVQKKVHEIQEYVEETHEYVKETQEYVKKVREDVTELQIKDAFLKDTMNLAALLSLSGIPSASLIAAVDTSHQM